MSYVYDAGVTTPGYAGLLEITSVIRLNSSLVTGTEPAGGTFKLEQNPFLSSPPVRLAVSSLPSDSGGAASPPFYDPYPFTIGGWLWVPSGPDDVAGAEEQLRAAFAAGNGPLLLTGNMRGWATKRQITAQTNGQITFTPRHGTLRIPTRDFSIPMIALDPLAYDADNLRTQTLPATGAFTNVVSNGTVNTPFSVTITGPITNPVLTRQNDAKTIALSGTIASGHSITITTNPVTGISAVDDLGANVYGKVSAFAATWLMPGTRAWTLTGTSTSGATAAVISWRDAWA